MKTLPDINHAVWVKSRMSVKTTRKTLWVWVFRRRVKSRIMGGYPKIKSDPKLHEYEIQKKNLQTGNWPVCMCGLYLFAFMQVVLITLAFQDGTGCGSSKGGCTYSAGSITNTQAHVFWQLYMLLFPAQSVHKFSSCKRHYISCSSSQCETRIYYSVLHFVQLLNHFMTKLLLELCKDLANLLLWRNQWWSERPSNQITYAWIYFLYSAFILVSFMFC